MNDWMGLSLQDGVKSHLSTVLRFGVSNCADGIISR